MKKVKYILTVLLLAALLIPTLCVPAFAITESEVEAQVAASGKGAVTGNVLIWFLCAVAFLKVSQKIDSFMATLGVNVGRTGGSMLAEAMIAMRAVTMVAGGRRGSGAAGAASGSAAGKAGSAGMSGFFKGGLVGMAGRHITNNAVRTATTQTSAVHTAQSQINGAAATSARQASSQTHVNSTVHTGNSSIHTENSVPTGTPLQEGCILTGSGEALQAVPLGNTSPAGPVCDTMPPQEGTIFTEGGASPQVAPVEKTLPASPVPDGIPPQEGVILTGNEAPVSMPQADPAPQAVGTPAEDSSAGMTPPQEGVAIAGGNTAIYAAQTGDTLSISPTNSSPQTGTTGAGGEQHTQAHTERVQTSHTSTSSEKVQASRSHVSGAGRPTLGGMVFSRSLATGGGFANDVIGTVARGEVAGSITGDMAAQSLTSYMGYASPGIEARESPSYSDVEIGRGRITGVETAAGTVEGRAFAMYHVEQYTVPSGDYTKVVSADGTQWYKQYAQDTVERKPYMAPDDTAAYHEKIVKKMPDPPKRKDRI